MAAARMSVVEISVTVEIDGRNFTTQIAGSYDALRSVEAARGVGRQIGDQLGECLALRIQHGGPISRAAA
ncbi:hypothetical protein [Brevundimonas vesicularis]|uniref:hypothetical protein n=1 Tax=Brevundimonas vesicularis TaxID=41276 RepID=UPI0022AC1663|nr:hypothetical protein [Brevundimonas vesicularis]